MEGGGLSKKFRYNPRRCPPRLRQSRDDAPACRRGFDVPLRRGRGREDGMVQSDPVGGSRARLAQPTVGLEAPISRCVRRGDISPLAAPPPRPPRAPLSLYPRPKIPIAAITRCRQDRLAEPADHFAPAAAMNGRTLNPLIPPTLPPTPAREREAGQLVREAIRGTPAHVGTVPYAEPTPASSAIVFIPKGSSPSCGGSAQQAPRLALRHQRFTSPRVHAVADGGVAGRMGRSPLRARWRSALTHHRPIGRRGLRPARGPLRAGGRARALATWK